MTDIAKPDLCVIGGGHAGLTVARRAAERGMSVMVIEAGELGGAGRLADAVPAATLAAAGARAQLMRTGGDLGLTGGEPKVSLRALGNRIAARIADMARDDAAERCAALGIEVVAEAGRFTDRRTFTVGDRPIRAKHFVLAIDGEPVIPAIDGLRGVPYFTSRTIGGNTRKLSHLLVIGGGATGLAVAQAYKRLGSQVTVVESGKALASHDPEFAAIVLRHLNEEKIDIREETAITAIQRRSQGIGVTLDGRDGEAKLDISHVMVAAGSRADLGGLDVEKAGLRPGADGRVAAGSDFRTGNRAIFALPPTGGSALAAAVIVDNALGGKKRRLPPELVPRVVATEPMLVEVGLTEALARARHKQNYRIVRCSFGESDTARAEGRAGSVRVILDGRDIVIGAGVVGADVAELAALFSFAIANRLGIDAFAAFVPPAGSLAEIAPLIAKRGEKGAAGKTKGGIARWLPLPGRIL
jgi:pyruvate/2-oxoglutarate dehydrogenase complex dihydrolipoamide dehydrogenase (E3) component